MAIKQIFALLFFLNLLGGFAFAGGGPSESDQGLSARLNWLKTTSGKVSEFDKKVHQELQGRTETSEGKFSVRKGSLKIAVKPPNETLLVVNAQAIWLETPMGEDFPVSVQKMRRKGIKGNNEIWNVLMGSGNVENYFKVGKKKKGTLLEFNLTPKKTESSDLASAKFVFDGDQLKELSYTDDIANVVTYNFKNWKDVKLSSKDFDYKPPKNAEVTEL